MGSIFEVCILLLIPLQFSFCRHDVRVYKHTFKLFNVLLILCLPTQGTGQTATKYAIKTLTVCTAASHSAREELVKSDKSEK